MEAVVSYWDASTFRFDAAETAQQDLLLSSPKSPGNIALLRSSHRWPEASAGSQSPIGWEFRTLHSAFCIQLARSESLPAPCASARAAPKATTSPTPSPVSSNEAPEGRPTVAQASDSESAALGCQRCGPCHHFLMMSRTPAASMQGGKRLSALKTANTTQGTRLLDFGGVPTRVSVEFHF